MGKISNKGLSEYDQEEGLFKRLTNIENAQKNLVRNYDKDDKDDKEIKIKNNKLII